MSNTIKILAFAGSARKDSFNKKLAKLAAKGAESAGAKVTFLDLKDYPLPLYDQDVESEKGLPDNAKKVKQMLIDHDGFLIACPEYNSSITPLLKNTIDWCSRAESENEPPLQAFKGKTAAIISASPGALGGLRGLVHARAILSNIGVLVVPNQRAIGGAHKAFDDQGQLTDAKQAEAVEALAKELVELIGKLK